ncbi:MULTISPECIES: cell wall-active antibiotics response protein LiaF [unclassified Cytobacillus]|uniref:cell wall-active antibiotics response protein LiaF n=1 Tax=unclassified Cytobacillus TaxID=2675268 RepID=UPI00135CCB84|nr:cell wall-active antibiotics response protein LiaF [Cytobacillus sp. AMY 15.2]KAF0820693.1 Membrane protein LiaF(VraT), specific inhibitor of LiaRS(VraRS) signaling pathway [Bacillus sp. ZZV12-4809]MCM3090557.1 cell wall-active antibiotics response protein LiaF [Cytobacillus sp. AMY 15.2]
MNTYNKRDYMNWIIILGIVFLFIEIAFFNSGMVFSLLVPIGMVYIGRKWMPKSSGKWLFWLGLIILLINILGMMTLKFFLLAILVHLLIQFGQSKKDPKRIHPDLKEPAVNLQKDTVIKKNPLFSNIFVGQQKTPEQVYEWNDINIQTGIGDTVIDLSYTVIPKGETVIFIRNFIGNVQVLVPYDVEVSVSHSAIAGKARIFEYEESKMFNQHLHLQTPGFDQSGQRVKIFTSFAAGDLEVKRV